MNILVTGAAGFIGAALSERLLGRGHAVVGLDNFNDYYDPALKEARAARFEGRPGFRMVRADLADAAALGAVFDAERFDVVVNLAAQAGVRYSLVNPGAYVQSNLVGFVNVLECCRHHGLPRLVYASSSSVYGNTKRVPFTVDDPVNEPISLYAADCVGGEYNALPRQLSATPVTNVMVNTFTMRDFSIPFKAWNRKFVQIRYEGGEGDIVLDDIGECPLLTGLPCQITIERPGDIRPCNTTTPGPRHPGLEMSIFTHIIVGEPLADEGAQFIRRLGVVDVIKAVVRHNDGCGGCGGCGGRATAYHLQAGLRPSQQRQQQQD